MASLQHIFYKSRFEREWRAIVERARAIGASVTEDKRTYNPWVELVKCYLESVRMNESVSVRDTRSFLNQIRDKLSLAEEDLEKKHQYSLEGRRSFIQEFVLLYQKNRLHEVGELYHCEVVEKRSNILQGIFDDLGRKAAIAKRQEEILKIAVETPETERDALRLEYNALETESRNLQEQLERLKILYDELVQCENAHRTMESVQELYEWEKSLAMHKIPSANDAPKV